METPIHMRMFRTTSDSRFLSPTRIAGLALAVIGLLPLAGCSSSTGSSKPQVGAIAFTDANATPQKTSPTSLTASQGTYLDVTMISDPKLLGADWTAVCGSALPPGTPLPTGQTQDQSCGTFTPAHTISAPVPNYVANAAGYVTLYTAPAVPPKQGIVTLYASATSDPSQFTSVTISIGGVPISVGFAPAPPSSLGLSTSVQIKAVLNNDATGAGINWSVLCASSACGSFSATQTASGALTTYTSPATVPSGGSVKVTATSIADPTKAITATIQIAPISVAVSPAVLSVPTAGVAPLTATVANDGLNKGVDWTLSCTNSTTPGNCGAITSHTASGAAAAYTAPNLQNIAVGSTVVITATSTTDPTRSATVTVTTTKGNLVSGRSEAAQQPLRNARVTLFAAATRELALNPATTPGGPAAVTSAVSDQNGMFSIPYGYVCPTPDAQMYLVSTGGDAGAGSNPNLTLMAALGACSELDASHFVINEATTVASVYALSGFMSDGQHVGSSNTPSAAIATGFATAEDLVDGTTGLARSRTAAGTGIVPQAKINTMANLLGACAATSGSLPFDGSPCDLLFRATGSGTSASTQARNTLAALLNLQRNAVAPANGAGSLVQLYQLAAARPFLQPALAAEPSDWTIAIAFPNKPDENGVSPSSAREYSTAVNSSGSVVDAAGNIWLRGNGESVLKFVGAASCSGAPNALIPIAATAP